MANELRFTQGERFEHPLGKIVCVGRNYAEHAKELNNPVPKEPLLFMKPATSAVPLAEPVSIRQASGRCHYETEIALLVGQTLSEASVEQCRQAVVGVAVALDLTLRDLQSQLKEKGQPWEKAKAFDGACPLSDFVPASAISQWDAIGITMRKNGQLCQHDSSGSMITPVFLLLSYISSHFTLLPGDVVLTGTPAGVGELNGGDQLEVMLDGLISVSTHVISV